MFLKVENLQKFYSKKLPLIEKLSFSVNKGEIISFIGESGSGKTTFLKCLAGLEGINSGVISLNGEVLNNDNTFVKPHLRKIGFVFQDYPLFPHIDVIQNITLNLEEKFHNKIDYFIELTGLKNLESRYPHELSGGEQQRVCLARALVREPDLLLLDEPFSNLDSNIKSSIQDEIHRIIKKTQTTTILVTHDIRDTFNISDKILIFKAGILQQYDKPIEMYCNPVNCYCAKILGDLNQINTDNKTYYLRPENMKLSNNSKFKAIIEKSLFVGKEYKIRAKADNQIWHFFHDQPISVNEKVYIDFDKKDLLEFDSTCSNYFTLNSK